MIWGAMPTLGKKAVIRFSGGIYVVEEGLIYRTFRETLMGNKKGLTKLNILSFAMLVYFCCI